MISCPAFGATVAFSFTVIASGILTTSDKKPLDVLTVSSPAPICPVSDVVTIRLSTDELSIVFSTTELLITTSTISPAMAGSASVIVVLSVSVKSAGDKRTPLIKTSMYPVL